MRLGPSSSHDFPRIDRRVLEIDAFEFDGRLRRNRSSDVVPPVLESKSRRDEHDWKVPSRYVKAFGRTSDSKCQNPLFSFVRGSHIILSHSAIGFRYDFDIAAWHESQGVPKVPTVKIWRSLDTVFLVYLY